jgi:hypothetical protein
VEPQPGWFAKRADCAESALTLPDERSHSIHAQNLERLVVLVSAPVLVAVDLHCHPDFVPLQEIKCQVLAQLLKGLA